MTAAENISKQLIQKVDTNLPENRTFIKKHSTVVTFSASSAEEARRVQGEMKRTIEEVEIYHERTNDYQAWLDTSLQSSALIEPIGSEMSVVKRQLVEVEVGPL